MRDSDIFSLKGLSIKFSTPNQSLFFFLFQKSFKLVIKIVHWPQNIILNLWVSVVSSQSLFYRQKLILKSSIKAFLFTNILGKNIKDTIRPWVIKWKGPNILFYLIEWHLSLKYIKYRGYCKCPLRDLMNVHIRGHCELCMSIRRPCECPWGNLANVH